LELEARAGVLSSFLESIEGLPTLRALSPTQPPSIAEPLTAAQQPEFLLLSLQRWLAIVLDLLAAGLAVGVIALSVNGRVGGTQVGVALNVMLVTNSTLLKLVENWTSLEISMGAVARLQSLEHLTPAEDSDTNPALTQSPIPENWPPRGEIEFKDVCASYGYVSFSFAKRGGRAEIL
jgi:ABC-type multidrug transport system fused ATPase/permease subunit